MSKAIALMIQKRTSETSVTFYQIIYGATNPEDSHIHVL